MKLFTSKSLDEVPAIADAWLKTIFREYADRKQALVIGLSGNLGAGKTAFVKSVAKLLGIDQIVTSPTFVIMKKYQTAQNEFKNLIHIDAYRLERREDITSLGFEALVSDKGNLIMIEWPENVGLDRDDLTQLLSFEIKDGTYMISYV